MGSRQRAVFLVEIQIICRGAALRAPHLDPTTLWCRHPACKRLSIIPLLQAGRLHHNNARRFRIEEIRKIASLCGAQFFGEFSKAFQPFQDFLVYKYGKNKKWHIPLKVTLRIGSVRRGWFSWRRFFLLRHVTFHHWFKT